MDHETHKAPIPQEIDPASELPIGPRVANPQPASVPERVVLQGRYARLEPLDPDTHRDELFAASSPPDRAARFRYMPEPAPASLEGFDAWLGGAVASVDPLFFAVIDRSTNRVEGRQSLMRINPSHQSIEIGHIYWGPRIAGTRVATDAMYQFVVYAMQTLGYRRLEWKCDALNARSCRAARRFGLTYEGIFRRAAIVRDRSRDTAWFAMIAEEWPSLRAAYERWLAPDNFDELGRQRVRLSELTSAAIERPHRPGRR